jgi:cytochrome oxidase Cu insertion factor (SCO1/SenC/PrrC family)
MAPKSERRRVREQKQLRASRRKAGLWVLGIGVVIFAVYAAVTSGAGLKDPLSRFLSDEELAELPPAPERGAPAPDFTISDIDGKSFTLSEAIGKPTAIMFFHTW